MKRTKSTKYACLENNTSCIKILNEKKNLTLEFWSDQIEETVESGSM